MIPARSLQLVVGMAFMAVPAAGQADHQHEVAQASESAASMHDIMAFMPSMLLSIADDIRLDAEQQAQLAELQVQMMEAHQHFMDGVAERVAEARAMLTPGQAEAAQEVAPNAMEMQGMMNLPGMEGMMSMEGRESMHAMMQMCAAMMGGMPPGQGSGMDRR